MPNRTSTAGRRASRLFPARFGLRLLSLCIGQVLCAVGICLQVEARLGVGPWDVLHQGISRRTGISFGAVGVLVGVVAMVAWIPLRQRPGVGTLVNIVLVGLLIDAFLPHTPRPDTTTLRWVQLVVGLVVLAVGVALYLGAGLGDGPRDGLMRALIEAGLSVRAARTLLEVVVLLTGTLLGGDFGPGTFVVALGIGPVLHVLLPLASFDPVPAETEQLAVEGWG